MALALKACRRGGSYLLLPTLSTHSHHRDYSYDFFSSTSSRDTAMASPSSTLHFDFCREGPGLGIGLTSNLHCTGSRLRSGFHFTDSGLRSHRFFSTHGGTDEEKNSKHEEMEDDEETGDDEELSAEDDGDEEENEVGDGDDDGLQVLSETRTPLPNFKDRTEEAAYIGYKVIGSIKAGDFGQLKAPKAFAVVQVGSHQFKISPGDCIYTEKLKFADVNDKLSLEKVLLLGSKSQTVIGRPFVPKAFVHAAVEEQVLDAKVIIFKKKRRKNYRRTAGHRQELTRLRILEIWGLGEARSAIA